MKASRDYFFMATLAAPIAVTLFSMAWLVYTNEVVGRTAPVNFWSVVFLADGQRLATGAGVGNPNEQSQHGELAFWIAKSPVPKFVLRERAAVRSVASSPDGELVAIGEFDGTTKLVRSRDGKLIANFASPGAVNSVAFSGDSQYIASGCLDGTILLWNIKTQQSVRFEVPDNAVLNVAISPKGNLLAAGARDGNAYLFDWQSPGSPRHLQAYEAGAGLEANVETTAFSPDGTKLVTGTRRSIRLWDTTDGRKLADLRQETGNIESIAFAPDGKILAAVDSSGTLALWDLSTGQERSFTTAHGGISFSVAFSPNGGQIATIGRDENSLKIWDAQSLTLQETLRRKF